MDRVYTVVGYRIVDFVNNRGNTVQGLRLFLTFEEKHVFGIGCESVFISGTSAPSPVIGSVVTVFYNKFGKCTGYRAVE